MSGITINAERSTEVDFTYPFWLEPSAAVVHVSFVQTLKKFKQLMLAYTVFLNQLIFTVQDRLDTSESADHIFMQSISQNRVA